MNFIERRAFARMEAALVPMFEKDERILDFDVGRIGMQPADIVATTQAVYIRFRRSRTISRTPYREFSDIIVSSGGAIRLLAPPDIDLRFDPGRGPRPGLAQALREQMAALILHEIVVENPEGGSARWRLRLRPDGQGYFWTISPIGVVDPEAPGFMEWMNETTRRLSDEYGVSGQAPASE